MDHFQCVLQCDKKKIIFKNAVDASFLCQTSVCSLVLSRKIQNMFTNRNDCVLVADML